MKTQKELLKYYKRNLNNTIETYGLDSDYTVYNFCLLQAVRLNIDVKDMFNWASDRYKVLIGETSTERMLLISYTSFIFEQLDLDNLEIERIVDKFLEES